MMPKVMFALIKTGGKQYRVQQGDKLAIERIGDGSTKEIVFDEVLMLCDDKPIFGAPFVKGAKVTAKVIEQTRAKKVTVFKKKRRQNYRRMAGHRQHISFVEITKISKAA